MARGFSYAPGASDDVALARSAQLSRAQIHALATGKNAVAREIIAQRPDVPLGTMVGLAHDRVAEVRAAIAANAAATETVLEHLSNDRNVAVLHGLLDNPAAPPAIVERLAFSRKDEVRAHAMRRLDESVAAATDATDASTPELRERSEGATVVEFPAAQRLSLHEQTPAPPTRTAPVRGFLPAEEA